jgi:glycerate 2-kinase
MTTLSPQEGEELIRSWFASAVRAVDPERRVRELLQLEGDRIHIDKSEIPLDGKLYVASVGKAAAALARGAAEALPDVGIEGLVLTKDGHINGSLPEWFEVFEASHPIPDERGVRATRRLLERVRDLQRSDVMLALISGGGSALLEAPRPPLTLSDIARTTDLLLRAGAPIHDLNAVRIPLSEVKGGGLRRVCGADTVATLLLSDVLGNDPRTIASGPTVAPRASAAHALALLEKYHVDARVPAAVVDVLRDQREVRMDWPYDNDYITVVADNNMTVDALANAGRSSGVGSCVAWRTREGEARELAREWVRSALSAKDDCDLLVGGGEATVTVVGEGRGGRNTEFALAAALALEESGARDWLIASLATDGDDADTGVAGAIASGDSCRRAREEGLVPEAMLADNDSYSFFAQVGGLVSTGPTGTNVNDLYVALRVRCDDLGADRALL